MTVQVSYIPLSLLRTVWASSAGAADPADEAVRKGMGALAGEVKAFAALRDEMAAAIPQPTGQPNDNGCLVVRLAGAARGPT